VTVVRYSRALGLASCQSRQTSDSSRRNGRNSKVPTAGDQGRPPTTVATCQPSPQRPSVTTITYRHYSLIKTYLTIIQHKTTTLYTDTNFEQSVKKRSKSIKTNIKHFYKHYIQITTFITMFSNYYIYKKHYIQI